MKKEKMKHQKKQNIQRYMLKTYLVVTCISVFVECIFCVYAIMNSNRQLKENHQMELEKVALLMDDLLADVDEQSSQLSNNTLVQKILGYTSYPEYHGADVLDIRDVMNLFNNAMSYYNQIKSICLLNISRNTLISGNQIIHKDDYGAYLKRLGISQEVLSDIAKENRSFLYLATPVENERYIYFVRCIYRRNYSRPDGFLLFEIDMDRINGILQAFESKRGADCYLIENHIGYIGSDADAQKLVEKVLADGNASGIITVNRVRYTYTVTASDYMNIEYCYVTNTFNYFKDVYVTILFTIVSLIVMVIVSIFLAKRFTKENTQPLREMMAVMKSADAENAQFSYDRMLSDVHGIVGKMHSYEEQLNQNMMTLIVHGQEKNEAKILAFQEKLRGVIGASFSVMGLKLINLSEQSDREILLFCIMNIFSELMEKYVIFAPVESWDRVYFLVRSELAGFDDVLEKGIRFFEERFLLEIACGIGEEIHSLTQLQSSRSQADYMIEYVELTCQQKFAHYSVVTVGREKTDSAFSTNLKKMMHLVIAQDYEGCTYLLEKMWHQDVSPKYVDASKAQQRLVTIASIISIPYKERYGNAGFEWPVKTLQDTYQLIVHMLSELEQGDKDEAGKSTFGKMKSYIENHATESDITAGSVSEAFLLSASYASGMYKKFAGEGILDAIHKERIRQAKLLLQSGVSVQDAAVRTGYLDARGFIRTFKKYEGITPGQFKSLTGE